MRTIKHVLVFLSITIVLATSYDVARASITNWSYGTGGGFGASWGYASVTTSETIQGVHSWIYYATPGYYTNARDSEWGGVGYTNYGLRSQGLPGSCVDMAASIEVEESGNWEGNTQDGCP